MDAKLTLKLDQRVIEKAKEYASEQRLSLSRLIEHYLRSLLAEGPADDIEISPFVKSMSSKVDIPADLDYRSEYRKHLEHKNV